MSGGWTEEQGERKLRGVIILHSGAYDRALYAFSLATVALAMGMEVHMLCTYGGLLRLVKGKTEELGEETPPPVREILCQGLEKGTITPLSELIEEACRMGLKLYACAAALGNLNVARGELIEAVTASTGLAHFLELAAHSSWQFYI